MVSGLLVFCIFVVRPRTLLHHSVGRVLKIWNLVVPIQSSKKATAFSSSQYSFSVSSDVVDAGPRLPEMFLLLSNFTMKMDEVASHALFVFILHDVSLSGSKKVEENRRVSEFRLFGPFDVELGGVQIHQVIAILNEQVA